MQWQGGCWDSRYIPTPQTLLLGAAGFIGQHIAIALRDAGHNVLASARDTRRLDAMGFDTLQADLTDPATHSPDFWRPHVENCTRVINCAGLLTGGDADFHAVHVAAPQAVYAALPATAPGVLISAVGIDADTPFATYRRRGEKIARNAPLPVTILRPGLVLADGSYGGSSLARALAVLPLVTPVVAQVINPSTRSMPMIWPHLQSRRSTPPATTSQSKPAGPSRSPKPPCSHPCARGWACAPPASCTCLCRWPA
jgi:uncharacterized protein YbjT (DUF2867 family)